MRFITIFSCILVLIITKVSAQLGGESTYQFLELSHSARLVALGGYQVALTDSTDLNLPFYNPASLSPEMSNQVLFSYVNYFSDINFGYVTYARSFDSLGNFAAGMQYINYGTFRETTEKGEITGNSFKAAEYALNLTYSNTWKRINYGITLKPILSVFESYQSLGIALDAGLNYSFKNGQTTTGLVIKNLGTQFTTYYTEGEKEKLPLNLMAGISHKLKHAPLRLSISAVHLNNWDLGYKKTESTTGEFDIFTRQESFPKQIMRHVILGAELMPSKNFTIRGGYNFQRRQELKLEDKASTVGYSIGFGVKINRFRFDFGTSRFHVAGSSNVFSLAINLN
jgi:hypothetical protein